MKKTVRFLVTIDMTDELQITQSTRDMMDYVRTSIQYWKGSGDPTTPLTRAPRRNFRVRRLTALEEATITAKKDKQLKLKAAIKPGTIWDPTTHEQVPFKDGSGYEIVKKEE
jgi:hypothetical protein